MTEGANERPPAELTSEADAPLHFSTASQRISQEVFIMSDLLLDHRSKARLSKCLQPLVSIIGVEPQRLRDLKMGATSHVSLAELALISDALFPLPLVNVILDKPYHIRRVA